MSPQKDGFQWLNNLSAWDGGASALSFNHWDKANPEDAKYIVPDAKGFEPASPVLHRKQPPPLARKRKQVKRTVDQTAPAAASAAVTAAVETDEPKVKKHKP